MSVYADADADAVARRMRILGAAPAGGVTLA
jgi:hypothetical protein